MNQLESYANIHPHLSRVAYLEPKSCEDFVLHKEKIYISAYYGKAHHISIVDICEPENPKIFKELEFRNSISKLVIKDNIIYAIESLRALNFIDINQPSQPNYFDCCLLLDYTLEDLVIYDTFAIVAMGSDGIALIDISDLSNSHILHIVKWEDGAANVLEVVGDNIFVAAGRGGVKIFNVIDAQLQQIFNFQTENSYLQRLFKMKEDVWAVDTRSDPEKIWIIDSRNPSKIKQIFSPQEKSPKGACFPLLNGDAVAFSLHHSCTAYSPNTNQSLELFEQHSKNRKDNQPDDKNEYLEYPSNGYFSDDYMKKLDVSRSCLEDVECAILKDDYLYTTQGSMFNVFKLTDESIFHQVIID